MRPVYRVWLGKLYKLPVTRRWIDEEGDTYCVILPEAGMTKEQGVGVTVFDTAEQAIERHISQRKSQYTSRLANARAAVLEAEVELNLLPAKQEALEQARKQLEGV